MTDLLFLSETYLKNFRIMQNILWLFYRFSIQYNSHRSTSDSYYDQTVIRYEVHCFDSISKQYSMSRLVKWLLASPELQINLVFFLSLIWLASWVQISQPKTFSSLLKDCLPSKTSIFSSNILIICPWKFPCSRVKPTAFRITGPRTIEKKNIHDYPA